MRLLLASLTLLAIATPSLAFAEDVIDHEPFDKLLSTYVDGQGRVSYGKLKGNEADYKSFKAYVARVEAAKIDSKQHPKKARLAFYINAYNATVIQAVLADVYPGKKSVMDVKGFFDGKKHTVAGKSMTLNELENDLIRPKFKDARVHFVLVCAAKSCPKLQRKALTQENVYRVMNSATRSFINKSTSIKDGTITTSKLFEWFKDDFTTYSKAETVQQYLAKFHKTPEKFEGAELTFSDYDWALNKK